MTSKRWLPSIIIGALALAAGTRAAEGQLQDRLFLTPEERAILEARRWHRQPPPAPVANPLRTEAEPDPPSLPQMEPSETVTLSGVVLRSSGKQTIWLNNRAYAENGPLPAGIKPPDWGHRNQIKVVVDGKELQPGQTLTRATGQTREGFESQPSATPNPDERDAKTPTKK